MSLCVQPRQIYFKKIILKYFINLQNIFPFMYDALWNFYDISRLDRKDKHAELKVADGELKFLPRESATDGAMSAMSFFSRWHWKKKTNAQSRLHYCGAEL